MHSAHRINAARLSINYRFTNHPLIFQYTQTYKRVMELLIN